MFTENLIRHAADHASLLLEFHQGIEKEGLRALEDGRSSLRPHHKNLGHKLTHPYITTDYAENLLEFVTPVFTENDDLLDFLDMIQAFSFKSMDQDELIWPSSMPSLLPEDPSIPIANFGESNTGRLKSLYRTGLGHRYGRSMQSIAGMHFNYSISRKLIEKLRHDFAPEKTLKDFTDQFYFKQIRNFRRHSWILSYLFGASPVVDESFLKGKKHSLQKLGKNTWGREFGTSLRMGGLGYTSAAQKDISVCYNKIETYVGTLESARKRSYPDYEKIGAKVGEDYRQLNTNLLQIDNEFYSTLRPKRTAKSGESALQALHQHGVEYIEVRLLDLNPFAPEGISSEAISFLQLFLTLCAYDESPVIDKSECDVIEQNFETIVNEGRDPKARLQIGGKSISVKEAASDLLNHMQEFIDQSSELKKYYQEGLSAQFKQAQSPENTFSAKVLESIGEDKSFIDATLELAKQHKEDLLNREFSERELSAMIKLSESTFAQERELVSGDNEDFDEFLKKYFDRINIEEYP